MDTQQPHSRPSPFEEPQTVSEAPLRRRSNFALAVGGLIAIGLLIIVYLMLARTVSVTANSTHLILQSDSLLEINLGNRLLLLPGEHRIEVSAAGFHPQAFDIILTTAEKNWQQQLELKPLPGRLTVTTQTTADIYINNQLIGQSDTELTNIEAGTHQLKVMASRYKTLEQPVTIEGKNKHQQLDLTLLPDWIDVPLHSEPAGADVFIDNQLQGQTPLTLQLLSGIRQIKLSKNGYSDWLKTLNVQTDQPLLLDSVTLNPASAQLHITSSPAAAQITVNGIYQGETPLNADIEPGQTASVMAIKAGYHTQTRDLTIGSDNPPALHLKLSPILGRINLNVFPADAQVSVKGKTLTATEKLNKESRYSLQLPAAPQSIRISKEGFASQTLNLTPRPELAQHLNIRLLTNTQAQWQKIPDSTTTATGQSITLFKPNATFMMGANRREQGRRANETQYPVQLDRPFYLSPKPVSNRDYRQFERFHSSGNVKGKSLNGDQQPVVNISWFKAAQFCNWLSAQEQLQPVYSFKEGQLIGSDPNNNGYRLPTEAEWSWLARFDNGQMKTYPWAGNSLTPPNHSANFADTKALAFAGSVLPRYVDEHLITAPVGSFPANHQGVFDLAGNISEWLHDFYGIKTGLSLKPTRNPAGPASGDNHVIRGSSWKSGNITELRLAWRDGGLAAKNHIGFRIARSVIIGGEK
jgi:formylglycine-generating enzyme required for sulfatase activity